MSLLDQIIRTTRRRVEETRSRADVQELERRAGAHIVRGFRRRLLEVSQTGIAVIAELKKASPSKGLIRADFDVAALARGLEAAGGFQILEARAYGADAVLLIVAGLEPSELLGLAEKARETGLDVLCEVHDEEELKRALDAGCDTIGVNNRNLKTFHVDLNTSLCLAALMPASVLRVAESGIHSGADIARLRAAKFNAFLIGESLMRAAVPGEALRNLLTEAVGVAP